VVFVVFVVSGVGSWAEPHAVKTRADANTPDANRKAVILRIGPIYVHRRFGTPGQRSGCGACDMSRGYVHIAWSP